MRSGVQKRRKKGSVQERRTRSGGRGEADEERAAFKRGVQERRSRAADEERRSRGADEEQRSRADFNPIY